MLIVRTPMRVSFLGGGTDYPTWFEKNGGIVIGGAINKYSYLQIRQLPQFHNYKSRLVYSEIETVQSNEEVQHRAIKACLEHTGFIGKDAPGIEISHSSDLPSRTGTGSSSSFIVGLIKGLCALKGENNFPAELADRAIHVEQKMMGETVGNQDQTWAAHGGLNKIVFCQDGTRVVTPLLINQEQIKKLESHVLLMYTGITRTASEIAKSFVPSLAEKGKLQWAMTRLAEEGSLAVIEQDYEKLGNLIDQSWRLKCQLSDRVNTQQISALYSTARICGAFGGKLIGAGGGGCIMLIAPPEKHEEIITMMEQQGAIHVPISFDLCGSQIIFADSANL